MKRTIEEVAEEIAAIAFNNKCTVREFKDALRMAEGMVEETIVDDYRYINRYYEKAGIIGNPKRERNTEYENAIDKKVSTIYL